MTVPPKVKGIRVDVPSELARDDFQKLIDLCIRFEDGLQCHTGVGETRIFLVHPSHITDANKILKRYGVEIVTTPEGGPHMRREGSNLRTH